MKKLSHLLFLLTSCTNPYQKLHHSLDETLSIIEEFYPEQPPIEKLRQGMLQGLIQGVDGHGSYLSEEQLRSLVEKVEGGKLKLGIVLAKHKDGLIVRKVYENSAGYLADIKESDIFTRLDEISLNSINLNDFPRLIKEERPYSITLLRKNKCLTKSITPGFFVPPSTELKWLKKIAHLKFDCISKEGAKEVENQLHKIKSAPGLKGLILDLRDCPGGSFEAAVGIASQFLDGHVVIEMQKKKELSKFSSASSDTLNKLPIVILQNKNTCSAGEIIAAALKAHKRAILIGTTTGGNATAKEIFYYPNRSDGLILTIAFLNDPLGKRINNEGIEPHMKIEESPLGHQKSKDIYINKALEILQKNPQPGKTD